MMEEDADFFPAHPFSEEPELGTLIVSEPNLTHLEERLDHLNQRAKYYGEYSLTKLEFLEMIEDLQAMAAAIRRTAR